MNKPDEISSSLKRKGVCFEIWRSLFSLTKSPGGRKKTRKPISLFQHRNLKFRCREAASGIGVHGQWFFWLFWGTSQLKTGGTRFRHWAAITLTASGPLHLGQIGVNSLERNSQASYQFITSNLRDSQFVLIKVTDKGKNMEWISFIFSSFSVLLNISCKQTCNNLFAEKISAASSSS